jgi:starvation-inducible DNA-binding protein
MERGTDMSTNDHVPCLHPTRIDTPLEIRTYVLLLLQQTLACTVDLRSHIKQASWNVKGPHALQVQALFDTIATELDAYADLMAARITMLGGVARGTARTAVAQSPLPEYPSTLVTGDAHVQAIAERLAHYATEIRADIMHTVDVEDAHTAQLYTDISRGIETRLGGLDVYLHR